MHLKVQLVGGLWARNGLVSSFARSQHGRIFYPCWGPKVDGRSVFKNTFDDRCQNKWKT